MSHIRYTTAPDAYDGFGTVTLETLPLKNQHSDNPYRKVEIQDEALDWQTSRYASGMYPLRPSPSESAPCWPCSA